MMRMSPDVNMSKTAPEAELPRHLEIYRAGSLVPADELPMQAAARTGTPVLDQELEFRFQDRTSNWAYGNAVPLFDVEGKVRGVVATFIDITPLKKAEALLLQADRRKDEFLATLAHELRNPLAPIRNAVRVLQLKGPPDPDLASCREVIARQIHHMTRLLDDLFDVSRITHNKLELQRERVELSTIIQHAVETTQPHIDQGERHLDLILPSEPIHLNADPVRLAQVFANLINNAVKFTKPGGHIRVSCIREESDALVKVADDGEGIPAELMARIFDPFLQAERSRNAPHEGLGIGLSLVRGLVQLHGGTVEARSPGPGKGSEFLVRLPVLPEGRAATEAALHAPTRDSHSPARSSLAL